MLYDLNNSRLNFKGPEHQLNKLSKKLSGGNPAVFRLSDHGTYYAHPARIVPIKRGNLLCHFIGEGKTKKAAARDYLNQIKNGVVFAIKKGYVSNYIEYLVSKSKTGIVLNRLGK